jgi:hypothetical protein
MSDHNEINDSPKKEKYNEVSDLNIVKSIYIMKKIFSYLIEKKKLDIIKYNNNYKNKILAKDENSIYYYNYYRKISGKLKEIINNEEGKEYEYIPEINKYLLIYKGKYLNKKRNGEGKEYKYGQLIFEGKYLNGKRYGNGIEYDLNGHKKFEGEYLYGIKNGKGKEYEIHENSTNLSFEGEYLKGKRQGKGKEFYYCGEINFEGEYLEGKRWNGKGYNNKGEITYELINGNGYVKEYYDKNKLKDLNHYNELENEYLLYNEEYLKEEKNGKGKKYYYKDKLIDFANHND